MTISTGAMTDKPRSVLLFEPEVRADLALYRDEIAARHPTLDIRLASDLEMVKRKGVGAEILVAKAHLISPALYEALPDVKWIQALTSGTDPIDRLALGPDILVTSMQGIHGPQMSELAFLLMLALSRGLPLMLAHQTEHRWVRVPQPLLDGKTVLLVGVGAIAEMLAARCVAFGMRVEGISDGRTKVANFAAIYPRSALAARAAEADFVVVLVPSTPATRGLIDATVLRAMRPGAYLINIARGAVVDEAALLRALHEGWIAGAGLDVFNTEPLPPESPLWSAPNIIITPHIGGLSDRYARQTLPILLRNLDAYLAGNRDSMVNVVKRNNVTARPT